MSDPITRSLDLVARAQEGDRQALDRLFERYYPRILQIVRYRLGSRLRESLDSGDIVQGTFIAAVKDFRNFEMREEASLIHWLSKLVERQIIGQADYHGAQKRAAARRVPLETTRPGQGASGGVSIQHADDTTPLLEKLEAAEENSALVESMEALEPEHRELIILRNYVGASWETIAEETGRPSAAAARMMHARALLELGKLLRARGFGGRDDAADA